MKLIQKKPRDMSHPKYPTFDFFDIYFFEEEDMYVFLNIIENKK